MSTLNSSVYVSPSVTTQINASTTSISHHVITTQPLLPSVEYNQVNQQAKEKDWNTGISSCCDNIKSCICVCLAQNLYYAHLATRMDEHWSVGCCGSACGCIPGGHIAMRTKLRTKHNIKGDIRDDCVVMVCCTPCAMCQLDRQMNSLGYSKQNCCGCC